MAGAAGIEVYRGIPFAAPPVGPLRFEPPAPCAWSGVRDAGAFAPAPPQRSEPFVQMLGLAGEQETGEDCLYLNVYTPGAGDARRPVLVWIHGGAFINGSGAAPLYDGSRLAARGDAVVVTLNYRVGALGFLALDGAPANLGLLDQIAALSFVRDHIAEFGGDPGNVTVFGESAGAGSICALLAMPAARGLFRRAIVQSAAPDGMLDLVEARDRTARFSALLGGEPRKARVEALLDAQDRLAKEGPFSNGMLFSPVIDGGSLPGLPIQEVAGGAAAGVELIIGTTREELRLYALGQPADAIDEARLQRIVGGLLPGAGQPERVIAAYRSARPDASPADLYYAIHTDLAMRVPSIRLAEAHARHQPQTFMYLFTWPSPMQDGAIGACHALDLPFTFGTLDAPGMAAFAGEGPDAERVSHNLMDAWLAFARNGDPGHADIGDWPRYETERRATMELGAKCGVLDAPLDLERAAWGAALDPERPARA